MAPDTGGLWQAEWTTLTLTAPMTDLAGHPRTSLISAAGWAFYLACSWTWVIGMYLPVLLVRDFGLAGWVAFAVPNVLGAAAMGWVLKTPEAAMRIAGEHAAAVRAFSAVTISFQVFALLWLLPPLVNWAGMPLVAAALLCAVLLPLAAGIALPMNAVVVWLMSAAIFAMLIPSGALAVPRIEGAKPDWHLVGLVPACLFGFALCPYLDATFLHARANTDARSARIAFTAGFGLLFLAMIVFTLLYALGVNARIFTGLGAWLLASHLAVQVCFTISAHTAVTRNVAGNIVSILVAAVLGVMALAADLGDLLPFGLSGGELIYRVFMGFYGLFFPAYVLLVIVARASMQVYWAACVLALPFLAAGFIVGWMPAAAGGVLVILAAAIVGHRSRKVQLTGVPS